MLSASATAIQLLNGNQARPDEPTLSVTTDNKTVAQIIPPKNKGELIGLYCELKVLHKVGESKEHDALARDFDTALKGDISAEAALAYLNHILKLLPHYKKAKDPNTLKIISKIYLCIGGIQTATGNFLSGIAANSKVIEIGFHAERLQKIPLEMSKQVLLAFMQRSVAYASLAKANNKHFNKATLNALALKDLTIHLGIKKLQVQLVNNFSIYVGLYGLPEQLLNPSQLQICMSLYAGQMHFTAGNHDEALSCFDDILAPAPAHDMGTFLAHCFRAACYYHRGDKAKYNSDSKEAERISKAITMQLSKDQKQYVLEVLVDLKKLNKLTIKSLDEYLLADDAKALILSSKPAKKGSRRKSAAMQKMPVDTKATEDDDSDDEKHAPLSQASQECTHIVYSGKTQLRLNIAPSASASDQKFAAINFRAPRIKPIEIPEAKEIEAKQLMRQGLILEACQVYQQFPRSRKALLGASICMQKLGDPDAAYEGFLLLPKGKDGWPSDTEARFELMLFFYHNKQFDLQQKIIDTFKDSKSDAHQKAYRRSLSWQALGEMAQGEYKAAGSTLKDLPHTKPSVASIAANLKIKQGQYGAAEKIINQFPKRPDEYPVDERMRQVVYDLHMAQNQYDEAIAVLNTFEKASDGYPKKLTLRQNLAYAYFKQGKYDIAIKIYSGFPSSGETNGFPQDYHVRLRLAEAYTAAEQRDIAANIFCTFPEKDGRPANTLVATSYVDFMRTPSTDASQSTTNASTGQKLPQPLAQRDTTVDAKHSPVTTLITTTGYGLFNPSLQAKAVEAYATGLPFALRGEFKEAIPHYENAAQLGYRNALNDLGVMKLVGEGCDIDIERAKELLTHAAQQGDSKAKYNLAHLLCYYEDNPNAALDLLEQVLSETDASSQLHTDAQRYIDGNELRSPIKALSTP